MESHRSLWRLSCVMNRAIVWFLQSDQTSNHRNMHTGLQYKSTTFTRFSFSEVIRMKFKFNVFWIQHSLINGSKYKWTFMGISFLLVICIIWLNLKSNCPKMIIHNIFYNWPQIFHFSECFATHDTCVSLVEIILWCYFRPLMPANGGLNNFIRLYSMQ